MDFTCRHCGTPLPIAGRGRPRKFCTEACRKRHERASRLPVELTSMPRWVRWKPVRRKDRVSKMPITTAGRAASSTDPATWAPYAAARASTAGAGLGFVLGDGIGCIDLDHVLDGAGRLDPAAAALIASWPATFTEVSPSGDGLHLWFRMSEAPGTVRTVDGVSVETYSTGRYITVTGRRWPGTPTRLATWP